MVSFCYPRLRRGLVRVAHCVGFVGGYATRPYVVSGVLGALRAGTRPAPTLSVAEDSECDSAADVAVRLFIILVFCIYIKS